MALAPQELTYAADKSKSIIPILFDEDTFSSVMRDPGEFVTRCAEIEDKCPKLEAILNRYNRVPNKGAFANDFDSNSQQLIDIIQNLMDSTNLDDSDEEEEGEDYSNVDRTQIQDVIELLDTGNSKSKLQAVGDLKFMSRTALERHRLLGINNGIVVKHLVTLIEINTHQTEMLHQQTMVSVYRIVVTRRALPAECNGCALQETAVAVLANLTGGGLLTSDQQIELIDSTHADDSTKFRMLAVDSGGLELLLESVSNNRRVAIEAMRCVSNILLGNGDNATVISSLRDIAVEHRAIQIAIEQHQDGIDELEQAYKGIKDAHGVKSAKGGGEKRRSRMKLLSKSDSFSKRATRSTNLLDVTESQTATLEAKLVINSALSLLMNITMGAVRAEMARSALELVVDQVKSPTHQAAQELAVWALSNLLSECSPEIRSQVWDRLDLNSEVCRRLLNVDGASMDSRFLSSTWVVSDRTRIGFISCMHKLCFASVQTNIAQGAMDSGRCAAMAALTIPSMIVTVLGKCARSGEWQGITLKNKKVILSSLQVLTTLVKGSTAVHQQLLSEGADELVDKCVNTLDVQTELVGEKLAARVLANALKPPQATTTGWITDMEE